MRPIVQAAVRDALTTHRVEDRLLETEEAAKVLAVSPDWLYRHAKKLPFTRKLGPKMLRFSSKDIDKYLATRKIT